MKRVAEHRRLLPVGAEPLAAGGVLFRLWAPLRRQVEVVVDGVATSLEPEPEGYFGGLVPYAQPGSEYGFRLDEEVKLYPDPASRFQPDGPHGPSRVIDPGVFRWSDGQWEGVSARRAVIYELHIGTFTPEGSWRAAAERLPDLAELGVTILELMPVAEFPGRFGWGYDGVDLWAPSRLYGEPDDFRRFVDKAHSLGLGVILDVVYNHLGPDGNYLRAFSDSYFTDRYETDWGEPFNFDGPNSVPVREYVLANVRHWISEYHLDGLRLDATQAIFDSATGERHVVAEIAAAARAAAGERTLYIIAENEPQSTKPLRAVSAGGYGLDAQWNDDWHHSAIVALTGRNEAYYSDYLGAPQEFVSAAKYGYLYQGQNYMWQKQRRGTPALDLPPSSLINFIQNHDQIANSARGDRIHKLTSPAQLRAMTALLLLGPSTPMLFMGQEFAASTPFLYFADHEDELARKVARGRKEFLEQFPSLAQRQQQERLEEPSDPATFEACKLDFSERESSAEVLALHRDLLRLRREDETLGSAHPRGGVDGAVLGAEAFLLRFFGASPAADRLLIVNLGREMHFSPAPEPLLAPPLASRWKVAWTSEDRRYGGLGHADPESEDGRWTFPAHCAVFLRAELPGRKRRDVDSESKL